MRYQERIYIQNENSAVRNKDISNVNMSSDICIFEAPLFNLSGATKIDCSTGNTGTTGVYIVSTATTIPLSFVFTANTDSFTATNATFSYEVYKFNTNTNIFTVPPIYKSDSIPYSAFSGTNITTQNIPIDQLGLDGDYLVKGFYEFDACTDFLNRLGKKINTIVYRSGTDFGLYDSELDYYFTAFMSAATPQLLNNASNTAPINQLFQEVVIPTDGQTIFNVGNGIYSSFIVTLNGLVLSEGYDYTVTSGFVITMSGETFSDDIVTYIYTTSSTGKIVADNIDIATPIVSGVTDGQGTNLVYFNTTTGKYEVYTSVTPAPANSMLIMLNGLTLANGVDFYQSTSNPKRFILEGDLLVGDLVTMVYFPATTVVNGLSTNSPEIAWSISAAPQTINGEFTLEVSTATTFTSFYATAVTEYVVGQTQYAAGFSATGPIGTKLYYRVKNSKKYTTLCGKTFDSVTYSETVPITIQSNSINSY